MSAIELQLGHPSGAKFTVELQGRRERPLEETEDPLKFMHTLISCQSVAERVAQLEDERVRAAYAQLVHHEELVGSESGARRDDAIARMS